MPRGVQAMMVTDATVCPRYGQICGVPQTTTMNRQDALAYLRAEAACLVENCHALHEELKGLTNAPFDRKAFLTYIHTLRAYRGLVTNHALAITWLTHAKPCGLQGRMPTTWLR